ncbi:MAG: hypothetical protein CM15mP86_16090 [Gammaproteobacteria bacterium]|nr:MAG: hypothetical protein CM15mP86_16090 [Gammaproteobacteria bacterium]
MLNEIVEDAKSGMEKSLSALDVAFKKLEQAEQHHLYWRAYV